MESPLLFGKYCLLEQISVGGMAEVFRAKPLDAPDPDHYFAVKRILPHLAEDDEFIKMFVDEARLTVRLDHRNIVQTYELGQFQSSHYIVMEFIAGKDLLAFQKLVRKKGTILDTDMACHIIRQVAKGLHYAHNKTDEQGRDLGIIHRDVSPQNVLVSWDGRVRIIDFGIAKAASQRTKTRAGVMKGKFGYMSPEQVRGKPLDHRSDIFAMGILLWEMVTNQRLFKAGNQLEAMTMIGDPEVEPPSAINPRVSEEVDQIIMKALAADRDNRYQTGAQLAEDLRVYLTRQKPPFHPSQLTTWIRSSFRDEFEEEREKRDRFRQINTADDVRRQFGETYGEGGDDDDQKREDATGVWDVDEAPNTDTDLKSFVADQTVVKAGGLDLSDYDEWDDAPDTIDETEEVVEARIQKVTRTAMKGIDLPTPSGGAEASAEIDPDSTAAAVPNPREAGSAPATSGGPSIESSARFGAEDSSPPTSNPGADPSAASAEIPSAEQGEFGDDPGDRRPATADDTGGMKRRVDTTGSRRPVTAEAPTGSTGALGSIDVGKAVLIGGVGLAAVILISAGVYVLVVSGDEPAASGDLVVEVQPMSDAVEVFVDGTPAGDRLPGELTGIAPGEYTVEVDHPDYPPWTRSATVVDGGRELIDVDLAATGELVISWEETPEQMQLRVGGEFIDPGEEQVAEMELQRGRHLVEATAVGKRPIRQQVRVEAGEVSNLPLNWRRIDQLTLRGGGEIDDVEFDGTELEELPVILNEVNPRRVYQLRVGEFETALGYPELGGAELDIGDIVDGPQRTKDDYGWLEIDISGDERWQLVVDDVRTGLVLALEDIDRLPVAAGDRMVGFEKGDERIEFPVRVNPAETTQLRPRLRWGDE